MLYTWTEQHIFLVLIFNYFKIIFIFAIARTGNVKMKEVENLCRNSVLDPLYAILNKKKKKKVRTSCFCYSRFNPLFRIWGLREKCFKNFCPQHKQINCE